MFHLARLLSVYKSKLYFQLLFVFVNIQYTPKLYVEFIFNVHVTSLSVSVVHKIRQYLLFQLLILYKMI